MTTRTNRIEIIFQDARELHAAPREMLAQGSIRNAAEKAWGAAKRATDALILARTGGRGAGADSGGGAALRMMTSLDGHVRRAQLVRRYHSRQVVLHGECFYNGCASPSTRRSAGSARRDHEKTPNLQAGGKHGRTKWFTGATSLRLGD